MSFNSTHLPKDTAKAVDSARALEDFRHAQTVRRWKQRNTKKPSKVVYVSDYFPGTGAAEAPKRPSSSPAIVVSSTLDVKANRKGKVKPQNRLKGYQSHLNKKAPKKQRDPNSTVPYNHRARHTTLKRRIFALRHRAATVEGEGNGVEDTNATPRQVATSTQLLPCVKSMERIYTTLAAAMQKRNYALAAALKRRIHSKQRWLTRQLRLCLQDEEDGDAQEIEDAPLGGSVKTRKTKETVEQTDKKGQEVESVYCNFYPRTTELRLGQHPRQREIDHRSGRYPQRLSPEAVSDLRKRLLASGESDVPFPFVKEIPSRSSKELKLAQHLFVGVHCRNTLDDCLEDLAFTTLQALYAEQRELKKRQPLQFKARQRYVVGLHETIKCLRARRVKMVLLATDIELLSDEERCGSVSSVTDKDTEAERASNKAPQRRRFTSLHEAVDLIHTLCGDRSSTSGDHSGTEYTTSADSAAFFSVPCVTCMSRQRLSYAVFAKGSAVACVGFLHAEKNHELLKTLRLYGSKMLEAYPLR